MMKWLNEYLIIIIVIKTLTYTADIIIMLYLG